jgi:hypothetical protein
MKQYIGSCRTVCLLAVLAAIMSASCEKVIEFNGEQTDPYAVIYSAMESDSTLQVRLTYSRFFLSSTDFSVINNATIHLYSNGVEVPQATNDRSCYYFGYHPQPGDTLNIKVEVPGYKRGILTAGTRVPAKPKVEYVGYTMKSDDDANPYYDIHLRLTDPKGNNYYTIKVDALRNKYDTSGVSHYSYESYWFKCHEPLFGDVAGVSALTDITEEDAYTELTFSDANFDGRTIDFHLRCDKIYGSGADTLPLIRINLISLNQDLYRYTTTQKEAENNLNDGASSFFSEAVQVYTNVKNGIGVFGAKSSTSLQIPIAGDTDNNRKGHARTNHR